MWLHVLAEHWRAFVYGSGGVHGGNTMKDDCFFPDCLFHVTRPSDAIVGQCAVSSLTSRGQSYFFWSQSHDVRGSVTVPTSTITAITSTGMKRTSSCVTAVYFTSLIQLLIYYCSSTRATANITTAASRSSISTAYTWTYIQWTEILGRTASSYVFSCFWVTGCNA